MHSIRRVIQWKSVPGNWDTLHFSDVYESDNQYGIPTIQKSDVEAPASLVSWGSRPKLQEAGETAAVHFFLDDYRFESLWKSPDRNIDTLLDKIVFSPDFSLWSNMPLAMQIWNTYRNRWLGCHWQAQGMRVIPTISWSGRSSYDFCFAGVEQGSMVAISTVGIVRHKSAYDAFRAGFNQMMECINPSFIICYGSLTPLNIHASIPIKEYPTRWQQIREIRHAKLMEIK